MTCKMADARNLILLFFFAIPCCILLQCLPVSCHENAKYQYGFDRTIYAATEPKQTWNYTTIRPHAHMFWWLYYTTAAEGYLNKPLVLWLQGGPGASSTGFGNFQEIGPLDVDLNHRTTSWISKVSLLFVDNPVGTGFSYVDEDSAYTTNVSMIADDLVLLMRQLMTVDIPHFQTIPFYIFSESYGGKMTAAFSKALYHAVWVTGLPCNFKGLVMGDSWILPIYYVMTWAPYLYSTSIVDRRGFNNILKVAKDTEDAVEKGEFARATQLWGETENVVEANGNGVNFYNILKWNSESVRQVTVEEKKVFQNKPYLASLYRRHVLPMAEDKLSKLMNGYVREKLRIIPRDVKWGGQSDKVFSKQSEDFMKSVVDIVDFLLDMTNLNVVVYNGQLDLICNTLGTENWVQTLKWPHLQDFFNSTRIPIMDKTTGETQAFFKRFKNFSFYWILKAGHMVPADAGATALKVLDMIIKY